MLSNIMKRYLMSNIIVEEGYPADFHLGISMIFWFIFIVINFSLGILLILKALKTPLTNRKEIYIGYASFYFGLGIGWTSAQIGVLIPTYFIISLSVATTIIPFSAFLFIYYWEKNLISLKKIPTIWCIFVFFIGLIDLIYVITLGTRFFKFFVLFINISAIVGFSFIIILTILFTKRVIGDLRKRGFLQIFAFVFFFIGIITDHPPVVTFYPNILSIVCPITLIIAVIAWYFALNGICDGITSYYNQAQICTIHRGKISKGTHIYFCPNCNITYCDRCYEQVIKKDGCWNCQEEVKPEDEDKWEREVISKIEVGKGFKKKKAK